jgi:hypothetical protein
MSRTTLFLSLVMLTLGSTVVQLQRVERPFWRPVLMGTQAMVAAEHPLEARAA